MLKHLQKNLEVNRSQYKVAHQREMQLQLTSLTLLAVLLSAPFSDAQLSRQASRLAENLGLLLGLPLDTDMPRENTSSAPDFLMDVYNCWTGLGASDDRSSCLPVHDPAAKDRLEDVNVVRSIRATAGQCMCITILYPGIYPAPRCIAGHAVTRTILSSFLLSSPCVEFT